MAPVQEPELRTGPGPGLLPLLQDPNDPTAETPGTLDIVYHPRKVGKDGVAESGIAILVFKGSIVTTGVAYGTTH